ncbi:PHP domain-containing protein [Iocasia frigidifontis]|uniref:PHP domain-containing protein n=1 Tax=Iocasia fonsfrigidae TaxID=2682810 RepID=A0A8A7KHM9_9FIRM|nr:MULTISPECIES: PHP domain-containing protein [Halanaerobiaceae]AZO94445.1 PHP domain-containing protein [Halocella sp. SP3-1]QTL97382.1 PHP domain-containing protein [Iocasia fonsfrigidae]
MYIDFHCHTKLSKKFEFELNSFNKVITVARKKGLDAIVLTEHFHTINFFNIYNTLDKAYEYKHDYYDLGSFKVFCGMEVDIRESGHILIIGRKEDVLDIRGLFSKNISEADYPALKYLLDEADKRKMIKIGAHPAKKSHYLMDMDTDLLKRLDGLGLNGKDLKNRDKVTRLSNKIDIPLIAGSDTHHILHMGTVKNHFYSEYEKIADLKIAIQNREFETIITKGARLKACIGQLVKKMAKTLKEAQ